MPILLLAVFLFGSGCDVPGFTNGAHDEPAVARSVGAVSPTQGMNVGRAAHTATRLEDGRVLVAGGFDDEERSLPSAEVYDPSADSFIPADDMQTARLGHTATLLPNGRVLITGGYDGGYLASAELYDPDAGTFAPAGEMVRARSDHVATLLPNGKVLLAGGVGEGWRFLAAAELYDPSTDTFTPTGSMTAPRESHTATLLETSKVLIAGGHTGRDRAVTVHSSAELYDPATGTFEKTGSLTVRRHKHDATLLRNGRVLITGGSDERDSEGAYTSAELYDPTTGSFSATGNMKAARYKHEGPSVVLTSGRILVAGGASGAETYDPATRAFSSAAGSMGTRRLFSTATLLRSGRVLIAGGYDQRVNVSAGAWIYQA
ncbi:MAG: Kelch repeat-containing protein [Rubrobacter sp.]